MGVEKLDSVTDIDSFLSAVYGNEVGFVYIALKKAPYWTQHFFEWPRQRSEIANFIAEKRAEHDVYFGPALFREPLGEKEKATKDKVLGSRVFWVEIDGQNLDSRSLPHDIPGPSLRVASGTPGHEHWYWFIEDKFIPIQQLERVNRALTYVLGADYSGWDGTQVLRVINTLNHKTDPPNVVNLIEYAGTSVRSYSFDSLPEPPAAVEAPIPESIPDVTDVVLKYAFSKSVVTLFRNGVPDGNNQTKGGGRGHGLMALAYSLAEMQMSNEEALAILLNADERWGKFKDREDRLTRLMEMIVRSRIKYPLRTGEFDIQDSRVDSDNLKYIPYGFNSLLASEIELEWCWEGFLEKGGMFLVSGPSGIGKTQLSMQAAAHLALGKPYLDREVVSGPQRIGFFSLEMGHAELKHFLKLQAQSYTAEERELLEKNLLFFPLGEAIYLNRDEEKVQIQEIIKKYELDGIFIDSIGSSTEDSLSQDDKIRGLLDWVDRLRQRLNVFVWFIHHNRKASGDNKRPNKLDDVYGSRYITARPTTVMVMWPSSTPSAISLIPLKVRLSATPPPFDLHRDSRLCFTIKKGGITIIDTRTEDDGMERIKPSGLSLGKPPAGGFSAGTGVPL